ncbi:MAG: AAA family ATPase [Candidatus Falkowbacteria bacterium]
MKITELKIHGIKSYVDETVKINEYTVFVGENNSGKSNILKCLLWFFGKTKISEKDLNCHVTDDPFVEVEFSLSDNEEFTHPKEYLVNGKFRVRASAERKKILDKPTASEHRGYIGEEENSIKDTKLLGYSSVAKFSLGEVIYIPSVKALNEELKFTAKTALSQLVTKYVISRIKEEDEKGNHYNQIVDAIRSLSEYISNGENSALQQLKKDISRYMLDYDNISLGFELEPPDADNLIKSCFKHHTDVDGLTSKLPLDSQGDGFQRSMIFSLIANLAELSRKSEKKKTAKNECTFYLIEEPEIFLHPNHQSFFRNKLEELAASNDSQAIITSHSPYFLNHVNRYSQIKRIYLDGNKSKIGEVSDDKVDIICQSNGLLVAKAKNDCRNENEKWDENELKQRASEIAKEDHLRYLLWIDPTRANAFLSKKVVLVEGPTEKAFFSYIFNDPSGDFYAEKRTSFVTVIDVVGKFHIYKFAQLLKEFNIKVWCIYDGDGDQRKEGISHAILNQAIEELKTNGVIIDTLRLDPSLEQLIGLSKDKHKPDVGLYLNLEKDNNKCKQSEGYSRLIEFTRNIIDA